ncbi:putative quorum-sensing-regulated virulence factor [anaerobic digester metagenome]|jgi:uncharacterized protein (DUF3820 family)|nr:DUF3820 family protein [Tenuifilaceae bacterium]HQB77618.1 DUF3820 family protein [Tenuifilaceae bacterium]
MEDVNFSGIDRSILLDIARMEMPYGKYKGWKLKSLPEPYLVWMKGQGFPKGRLGMLLSTLYEIKLNGLEFLLKNL